jgi:hypothetical protein
MQEGMVAYFLHGSGDERFLELKAGMVPEHQKPWSAR